MTCRSIKSLSFRFVIVNANQIKTRLMCLINNHMNLTKTQVSEGIVIEFLFESELFTFVAAVVALIFCVVISKEI